MKIEEIPSNLAPRLNFILSKDRRIDWFNLDMGNVYKMGYPEAYNHANTTIKLFLSRLEEKDTRPLVIFTHAECLINATGHLILAGKLKAEEIKIFIIEDKAVKVSTFNNDGVLQNWPFGWFEWDIDLIRKDY